MTQPQVVITRKRKRLIRPLHLTAFILTAGASAPISAVKAMSNAAYNTRTDRLAAGGRKPRRKRAKDLFTPEELAELHRNNVPGR